MKERLSVGFMFKQINNIYEKEFNNLLRGIGITSSQCAVLDYLLGSSKEFMNQKDIEKALSLKNPTVTGILKRLDEKGFILAVPSNQDKRCKNIYPTEKAYDIQKKMDNYRKKIDRRLTIGMSKKKLQHWKRCWTGSFIISVIRRQNEKQRDRRCKNELCR